MKDQESFQQQAYFPLVFELDLADVAGRFHVSDTDPGDFECY
jgi:hypothetical protein